MEESALHRLRSRASRLLASPLPRDDSSDNRALRAMELLQEAEQASNPALLDTGIDLLEQAVAGTAPDHRYHAERLNNLGTALLKRSRHFDSLDDVNRAVELCGQAVSSAPADPARALYLSNLSGALMVRFAHTGSAADLNEAADASEQAFAATPAGYPDRWAFSGNLAAVLMTRFQQAGSLLDLDRALELSEQALAATRADDPNRGAYLINLVRGLRMRFGLTGSLADLDRAVELGEQAVAAARADDPDQAMFMMNLGVVLTSRFERTGALADLDRAVEVGERSVSAAGANRSFQTVTLSVLGAALRNRFECTGSLADLDRAVEVGEQAVAASPADLPDRSLYLSVLGAALARRSGRTGSLTDLDRAVEVGEQAVAVAGADYPYRVGFQANLALTLQSRSERTGSLADLNQSIEVGEQAADALGAEEPDRAKALSGLSAALASRFERAGALEDLDRAVELSEQAVAATPRDHPDRASFLLVLNDVLRTRVTRTGSTADRDRALAACREAAGVTTAPAWARATAAARWGRWAVRAEDWMLAADGFALAVGLLGVVAPRSLDRSDQEHALADLPGVGSAAAACCLQAGQVQRAVELWEQGRGVLLTQILDTRTDLTELAERRPDMAERFIRLRDLMDRPVPPSAGADLAIGEVAAGADLAMGEVTATVSQSAVDRRRQLTADFDAVLNEIRSQPGFGRFLLPPSFNDLAAAADRGPLVLINVSDVRSDALIVNREEVQIVSLPALSPAAVREHTMEFRASLDAAAAASPETRSTAEAALGDHLSWLWDVVTGPVLERMDITAAPRARQPWPRLWWCPSGQLAFLPLHAAGRHGTRFDADPSTVIDRVVSSYTPTVRSLIHARRPSPPIAADHGRAVVVAMPQTPGATDLPGAADEAGLLSRALAEQALILTGPQATYDTVLAALAGYPWAHFACHGESDLANPSASHLLLHDRPLTVLDVIRLRLDNARLAYLSACSTARTGAQLPDEAIHLAAAFHLAGYRHVIATLWPTSDRAALAIATDTYPALLDAESADSAAETLHAAVRTLRSIHSTRPSLWAALTHTGT